MAIFLNNTASVVFNSVDLSAYVTASATNPTYSTTVLVNNLQNINGAVGDISSQSITFTCNSVITVAVS